MKRIFAVGLLTVLLFCMCSCTTQAQYAQISATTLPVYTFSSMICSGTPLNVDLLISEQVSCLHDYTLSVNQVRAAEAAEVIVISGAGLEEFMEDIFIGKPVIDASVGVTLLCGDSHSEEEHSAHEHHHDEDPHIWLDPSNAQIMAQNICDGLSNLYPAYEMQFQENLTGLLSQLRELEQYGSEALSELSCRNLITFHDGFAYLANASQLTILDSVEEESGSEASAKELIRLIQLTRQNNLPAVFVETNSSPSAASVISAETGAKIFTLDMAMSGNGYFEAMYHNYNVLKEALE